MASVSLQLLSKLTQAYQHVEIERKPEDIEYWIDFTQRHSRLYKQLLNESDKSGEKRRYSTLIGQLKGFSLKFQALRIVGGGRVRNLLTDRVRWEELDSVFNDRMRTGVIVNLKHKDLLTFLDDVRRTLCVRLANALKKTNSLKVNLVLLCKYRTQSNGEIIEENKFFNTKNEVILQSTVIKEWFVEKMRDRLLTKVDEFQERDSGWSLLEIINVEVHINKYEPLKGGSSFIRVPQWIQVKKAVINVQNTDDNFCFLWSIMAARCIVPTHRDRTNSYPPFGDVISHFGPNHGFEYPMPLKDIPKFERLNNFAINVYGVETEEGSEKKWIVPLYLTKQPTTILEREEARTIHLLLIEETVQVDGEEETIRHYTWISNMSRLLSSQLSKSTHRTYICDRCLCRFRYIDVYHKHRNDCFQINKTRMIFPSDSEKYLKFNNFRYQLPVPYVVYADTECLLEKINDNSGKNTTKYQKHVPFSVAYYVKCTYDDSKSKFWVYRGEDCVQRFIEELKKLAEYVDSELQRNTPMNLTNAETRQFNSATSCYICGEPFSEDAVKHRDHCHFTGQYRGAAHVGCNLNYKESCTIPVVFHNLSGYDSHFFIKALALQFEGPVQLLPINKEKYISFTKSVLSTKVHLRFIDSFRFMASSIEKLSSYLEKDKMGITASHYPNTTDFDLVTRKGIFPYEYVDSWDKLNEKKLPAKEDFYSQLTGEHINDTEYDHACAVWGNFRIKTLGEYSDLYLKTDVLLLSDIFENFRESCQTSYNLDPLHYYTAPGLAFDAMLKMTKVQLELLQDPSMLLFIEKGIRGGVAQCSNRYGKANNLHMGDDYNQNEPVSYLMYLDVNNLYGAAMSHALPYGHFFWMNDWTFFNVRDVPNNSETGYILEVDLDYPEELHESHKDLPLCPEHIKPPTQGSSTPKLLTTLSAKKNYVVHYQNLKQYLDLGLQISKIHRILRFKQRCWLKQYIDLNTDLRKNSKNEFEKNFYKLMNNAVFGKTMENVRKQVDVKLLTKWEGRYGAGSYIAKPNFHSSTIFAEGMVIVQMTRTKVSFNKPIYVGFSILDLSKTYMYDFHYNHIKKTFQDRAKLLYTDTDSFIYHFLDCDIYEYIRNNKNKFDTSDYPQPNDFQIEPANKKVLGLMKDENNGHIMTEFVGLRAKMYSYRVLGDDEDKSRAKGVKRATLRTITFNDYKACLEDHENLVKRQNLIRSIKHGVYTIKQQKLALSWMDDKRILLPNSTDTIPYGYKRRRIDVQQQD